MTKLFNFLKGLLLSALNLIISVLPDSPFQKYIDMSSVSDVLPYFNYFLPISRMIAIGEAWIACIAVYYLYSTIMRWAKAID